MRRTVARAVAVVMLLTAPIAAGQDSLPEPSVSQDSRDLSALRDRVRAALEALQRERDAQRGSLFREPFMLSRPVNILPTPGAPLELTEASLLYPDSISAQVRPINPREFESSTVTLRLGARLDSTNMLTFRLRQSSPRSTVPPQFSDFLSRGGTLPMVFNRIWQDGAGNRPAFRRDSIVYVTIEEVVDAAGRIVFEHPGSLEELFEAVQKGATR